jgi:hypothetical protein
LGLKAVEIKRGGKRFAGLCGNTKKALVATMPLFRASRPPFLVATQG